MVNWIALDAPTGRETAATDAIARTMPGWTRDPTGDLIAHRGSGAPRRVVACGLDDAGYVVSAITDAGYVRLAAPSRSRHSPLWDQFHEGQRIRILTAAGPRPAVVAVRSTHLWRRRPSNEPVVGIDDLWVDVGARSRAEVAALGIAVLDPVEREWPATRFADFVAGPAAAARAGCAAVAASAAARGTPARGETIWIIGVQHAFNDAGLTGAVARLGHVDTLVLVEPDLVRDSTGRDTTAVPRRVVGTKIILGLRTRFAGTLVETVRDRDIAALVEATAAASGVRAGEMPPLAPTALVHETRQDSLSAVADVIGRLCDTYGASGHETAVRDAVRSMLPTRYKSSVDTAGNLIVAIGPERDTTVFIAHLDELGYDVVRIDHDGLVTLTPLGGFYNSLWEGQPAILHTSAGERVGVFVPRATATVKQPDTLTAWFGVDSAELMRDAGAQRTLWLTGVKHSTRLGMTRFTERAIDDRAGVTALLLALGDIDPARLDHKVIFVFSVREETGLDGAAALAAELGPSVRRVHAVDTFVSSDSPLETGRFAIAPIGDGAVVRALDNSSVTPPVEIDRVRRIAAAAAIPLQVGVTNGGNDGSALVRDGAVNVPLAWPLRYSHSPAELIDLTDVHALARLVSALAMAPTH